MKKTLYSLLIGALMTTASCSGEMDEKHENPDAFTKTKIEYLFAQGAVNTLVIDYGDTYTYNFNLLGIIMQTTATQEGKDRINTYQNYSDDWRRWDNYYINRMNTLTEIDKVYASLSPEEQGEYKIYVMANKVLKAYNTAMATDFFGNMPYSEAFTARNPVYNTGDVIFRPKYDKQQDIYYSILADLEEAGDYFKTASTNATFQRQDVVYSGDCALWSKFANSLRLRYAMRISNVDVAKAKSVLQDLKISDLITKNADNTYLKVSGIETAPNNAIWRAFAECHDGGRNWMYAPELMVNLMTEAEDPRIPVFFQNGANKEGKFPGTSKEILPYPSSADDAIELGSNPPEGGVFGTYGTYNYVTFRNNYYLPIGVATTAAETYFCLAEAAQRGLISGNAAEYYNKGIIASVQTYYDFYKNSTDKSKDPEIANTDVSDAALSAWLNNSSFKFNPAKALEQIATQKWMHLNFMQIYENWAEYRRTDYPILLDDRENGELLNKQNAPVRLLYPASEASMNTDNYNAEAANNKLNARLWWDVK